MMTYYPISQHFRHSLPSRRALLLRLSALWPLFLIPSHPGWNLPLNSCSVGFVTRIV